MQAVKNISHFETLHVKNEVISIDEVEIQSIKNEELPEEAHKIQNGASKLIYYFEPQEKSNFVISMEDKSKSKVKSTTTDAFTSFTFFLS